MNAKEIFSAAVRVIGLFSLSRSLTDLAFVAMYLIGSDNISVTAKFPGADLVIGLLYLSSGLYLVRGAPLLVNFAFPEDTVIEEVEPDEKEDTV